MPAASTQISAEEAEEYVNSAEFRSSAMKAFEAAHAKGEVGLAQRIQTYLRNHFYLIQAMFKPAYFPMRISEPPSNILFPTFRWRKLESPSGPRPRNLVSGEQITFSKGSLRQAVMASCAVPGAIAPLKEGERLLSDGGIICSVPVLWQDRRGRHCHCCGCRPGIGSEELRNVVDVYLRVNEIMGERLKQCELAEADVVIRPEVGDLHWSSFSEAMNLIDEGEKAAREKLDDIRRLMPASRIGLDLRKGRNRNKPNAFC